MISPRARVIHDLIKEIQRAEQAHPNFGMKSGTSTRFSKLMVEARSITDWRARNQEATWADVLSEEFLEAVAEVDPVKLRAELLQVAAVAARWVEYLDTGAEGKRKSNDAYEEAR